MTLTLQGRFNAQVRRHPDRRALGFYTIDGETSWLTFGELDRLARASAGWLRDEGVRRGDVVVLALPSGRPCAVLILAVLTLGGIPLVIAPPAIQGGSASLAETLLRIVRRTKARLVVADPSLEAASADLGRTVGLVRYLAPEADAPAGSPVQPFEPSADDIAAYQLTSGTTGFPRICVWKQRGVAAALDAMHAAMDLRDDDLCVNWTPLYHDMGLVNNFFLCLTTGIPLVLLSPLDFVRRPAIWLRALSDTKATQTWSPNFGFALAVERVRDAELAGVRLDAVRGFWNAAERIHAETIVGFQNRFRGYGVRPEVMKTNFGCAENVGGATFSDPHGTFVVERVRASALYERGVAELAVPGDDVDVVTVVSAGRPSPGLRVVILGRNGKPLADGRVGEVALETPSRMLHYLHDTRSTAKALRGGLLKTGDLGYVRGEEFFWTGRVRERITIRGRKLDPSDFEPVLLDVDGLRRGCFVAFGVEDPERGTEGVVVAAELRTENGAEHVAGEIRERVLRQLGIVLDDVVLVERGALTKTTSGKRRHRAYRQMYRDGTLDRMRVRGGR